MKNLLSILFAFVLTIGFTQEKLPAPTPTPLQVDKNCCAYVTTITLNKTQINNLHNSPVLAIAPPAGFGVRLVKTVVLKTYFDGVNFVFASGEYINISNGAGVLPIMSTFSDPCVTDIGGIYSGSFYHNYEVIRNGQMVNNQTNFGQVNISATFPITGGGTNCKMIFIFYYDLVNY